MAPIESFIADGLVLALVRTSGVFAYNRLGKGHAMPDAMMKF
jgi:hypothetical protein